MQTYAVWHKRVPFDKSFLTIRKKVIYNKVRKRIVSYRTILFLEDKGGIESGKANWT